MTLQHTWDDCSRSADDDTETLNLTEVPCPSHVSSRRQCWGSYVCLTHTPASETTGHPVLGEALAFWKSRHKKCSKTS